MHVSFILYGSRMFVEHTLRAMEAEVFYMPMFKGKQKKLQPIFGQIRQLPLGIYEYIFPREYRDLVLTTLGFQNKNNYLGKMNTLALRKMIGHKRAGKFDTGCNYLWNKQYTSVIPIGFKEDTDFLDDGWQHEAI